MNIYYFKSDSKKDSQYAITICSVNYLKAFEACIRFFRRNDYKGMPIAIFL